MLLVDPVVLLIFVAPVISRVPPILELPVTLNIPSILVFPFILVVAPDVAIFTTPPLVANDVIPVESKVVTLVSPETSSLLPIFTSPDIVVSLFTFKSKLSILN